MILFKKIEENFQSAIEKSTTFVEIFICLEKKMLFKIWIRVALVLS
jgi:hypothetical protein